MSDGHIAEHGTHVNPFTRGDVLSILREQSWFTADPSPEHLAFAERAASLLGAAGLGDIGTHFPDTDPKWKGANSLLFLDHARKLLEERGLHIGHVDVVVILERPKLGPHFPKMREALAKSLGVPTDKIHLKAKTNEGVDAVGRGEAIASYVVATLQSGSSAPAFQT